MNFLRLDLVFSYWLFFWFILYLFKIVRYSPKFSLILGLIENIIMLLFMFLYGTSKKTILYFIIINFIIKVIPLYFLRKENIIIKDIIFTIIVFCCFILWIYLNNQTIFTNIKIIYESLIFNQNITPLMSLIKNYNLLWFIK